MPSRLLHLPVRHARWLGRVAPRFAVLIFVLAAGTSPAHAALDPAKTPGQNFNLSRWKLQLPVKTPDDPTGLLSLHIGVDEIFNPALVTYTSPYFYTNPTDGAMTFYAPITGSTTSGSNYPRSELRELYSSSQNSWYMTDGTAILDATVKVLQVPVVRLKTDIGQIHGDTLNTLPLILSYQNGTIWAEINYSPDVNNRFNLNFPSVGPAPTGLITYRLVMVPGAMIVTINGVTQVAIVDGTVTSGWPKTDVYFKAGDYCQANPSTEGANSPAGNGARTAFYSLAITHISSALKINPSALPTGQPSVAYNQTLQAMNATGALIWSLPTAVIGSTNGTSTPGGSLPAGLSLSSNGVISGTPATSTASQTFSNIVVQVTDASGAIAVQTISLSIGSPPPSRVVNLSVRSNAGTGSQTLIVGFVITGTGNKNLLLRGMGPALGPFGVANALPDPSVVLFNNTGTQIDANDNWGGSSTMADRFNAVGAFVPATDSKDATLYSALTSGVYSFHVIGSAGISGVALAELYDTDASASTAQLVNISARTQVGTGENTLIAGFVITGGNSKTMLIRGLGPTLTGYGVTGVLADPQLSLYQGGAIVAANNDWAGTTALKGAFALVGAFPLESDTSKDAALLATLPPGIYSAQVSGVGGTTGVALVEIYVLP